MDGIRLAEHLLKIIRERKESFVTSLSDGAVESIQDYRFIVGQIRGMTYAEDEIKAAMKGLELEDE